MKKKKPTTKAIVELMILESYTEKLRYQKLIDEWDNPKDFAVRSAVLLQEVHETYGKFATMIYLDLVKSK